MKGKAQRALILLCCLAAGLNGCAAVLVAGAGAGIGYGAYRYVEGNLIREYLGPMPKVWDAAVATFDDLKMTPNTQEKDYFGGVLKGRLYDGTEVVIKLNRQGENSTEVGVRVGLFGNREISETIHTKIAEHFKSG